MSRLRPESWKKTWRLAPTTKLLTDHEIAVLDFIAKGLSGPQMATELGVQVTTIETYRYRIRKKLGLRTRREVIEFARAFDRMRNRP